MHEDAGLHQAFQYFSSLSANSIFYKKATKKLSSSLFVDSSKKLLSMTSVESNILSKEQEITAADIIEEDSKISHEECTPFTSRSNSNISINSLISFEEDNSPRPSPSSSITVKSDNEKPWRLNLSLIGHIQQNESSDYFFMDRQDMITPMANNLIERDSYGFKRPTQWIEITHLHQFDLYYQPILDEQQNKWKEMIFECAQQSGIILYPPTDSLKLRECVRKGIPSEYRGKMWLHYSGAKSKMKASPGLYQSLVNTANLMGENNEYAEIIQRDLHRTFPDNSKFASGQYFTQSDSMKPTEELLSLQRVLLAFSIHSPDIGYCQSLNYLAGFFLLFVEKEEEAFWMLVSTVHEYMPNNMYDMTMKGANLDQAVLLMYIKENFGMNVWNKLVDEEKGDKHALSSITLMTNHWFLTMFINILPVETVLRVWDCFFVEGYKVLFQVALTIIYMNKDRISSMQDSIEIFQILQNMPRRLIDCPTFMDYVFSDHNLFVNLSQSQIDEKREICKEERENC